MNTILNVDLSKMNADDMKLVDTTEFGTAFTLYMKKADIDAPELAKATGVSERTIWRYRSNANGKFSIKCLTAICVELHLAPRLSEQLIHLAGLSLKPTPEQNMYFNFLCYAYCTDLMVEQCNEILVNNGFKPLTAKKSSK